VNPVWWYLNRVAAGVLVAAITGASIGLAMCAFSAPYNGVRLENFVLYAYIGLIFGAALGGIPGIAVMFFTRACAHPWQTMPIILTGTVVGGVVVGVPLLLAGQFVVPMPSVGLAFIVLFPAVGGIVATRFLPRSD
jgi:hypothetical protein